MACVNQITKLCLRCFWHETLKDAQHCIYKKTSSNGAILSQIVCFRQCQRWAVRSQCTVLWHVTWGHFGSLLQPSDGKATQDPFSIYTVDHVLARRNSVIGLLQRVCLRTLNDVILLKTAFQRRNPPGVQATWFQLLKNQKKFLAYHLKIIGVILQSQDDNKLNIILSVK